MNKSTQTKELITEAAFRTYQQNPRATLADVAHAAQLGRATLHRHFNGRDDLLRHMFSRAINDIEQITGQATVNCQSYNEALKAVFVSLVRNGQRLAFIMSQPVPDDPKIKQRLANQERHMHSLLQACRTEGIRSDRHTDAWLSILFDHLIHAGWEWQHKHHIPWEQAADQAWAVFERSFQ